jgi:hypothetical protein
MGVVSPQGIEVGSQEPRGGDGCFRELNAEADRLELTGEARERYLRGAEQTLGWTSLLGRARGSHVLRAVALLTAGVALAYGLGTSTSTAASTPSSWPPPTAAPVCIVSNPVSQNHADVSGPEAQRVCDWASNVDLQRLGPLNGSVEMHGSFGGDWEGPAIFNVFWPDGTQAVVRTPRGDNLSPRQFGAELARADVTVDAG